MEEIVYSAEIKGCTAEEIDKIREMFFNENSRIDLSVWYTPEIKERILAVEMEKARERLQSLCDDAYGKGARSVMIMAQKMK